MRGAAGDSEHGRLCAVSRETMRRPTTVRMTNDARNNFVRRIAKAVVFAAALLVAAYPAAVAADGPGGVFGVVTNGTAGSTVPPALPVTLTKYVAGIAVETTRTAADENGRFVFEGLETDSQIVYQVRVEHEGAQFVGDLFAFSDSDVVEVGITLYEVDFDDPGIEIARHVIVYTPQSDTAVRALEIVTLTNSSDRAFAAKPDAASPLSFSLPRGTFDFVVMLGFDPEQVEFAEDAVSIGGPVYPGSNQISFAYSFPWRLEGIDIPRRTPFRTAELVIMAPAEELTLNADRVRRADDATIEGRELWVWRSVEPIAVGEDLTLVIKPPGPSLASRVSAVASAQWGVASVGAALGSLAVYLAIRFRRLRPAPRQMSREDRARALLELLAESKHGGMTGEERRVCKDELIQILDSDDRLAGKLLGLPPIPD